MSILKHKIKESNFPDKWMDNKPYIPVPKIDWIKDKHLDVSYGEHPQQKIDIYYPNENKHNLKKYPILFIIHGGGFSHMDKADWHVYPGFYWLERGYMLVSINYRLAPKSKFPAGKDDSIAAIQYMIDHAEQYKVDTDNIFIMGASAGGNLTLISGLSLYNDQQTKNYSVKGLGALCPVTDLTGIWFDFVNHKTDYPFLARVLIKKTLKDYIAMIPSSETSQSFDASFYLKDNTPPIYFQLGEFDPVIRLDHVVGYAKSLESKGEIVIDVIKDGQHMGATKHFFLLDSINGYLDFFESKITI